MKNTSFPTWVLALPVPLLAAWLWFVVQRSGAFVPGDLGDTRSIAYIAEHLWRWLMGEANSLLTTPHSFPKKMTLFSEPFPFAESWIYLLLRLFGADSLTAFGLWHVSSFVLNYAVMAWCLHRLGFPALAIITGALFYAIALPVTGPGHHLSYMFRLYFPLTLIAWFGFVQHERLSRLSLVVLLIGLQGASYMIFTVFQVLLLVFLALASHMRRLKFCPGILGDRPALEVLRHSWGRAGVWTQMGLVLSGLVTTLCLFVLWYGYSWQMRNYGARIDVVQLTANMPHIFDYIKSRHSLLWGGLIDYARHDINLRTHDLFIGLIPAVLVIWSLFASGGSGSDRARSGLRRLCWSIIIVFVLLTLLVTYIPYESDYGLARYPISLWTLLYYLPGLEAVRAPIRVIHLLLVPVTFLLACAIDDLCRGRSGHSRYGKAVAALLAGAMVVEMLAVDIIRTPRRDWSAGVDRLEAMLPDDLSPDSVVMFHAPAKMIEHYHDLQRLQYDAMYLAYRRPIRLMNGWYAHRTWTFPVFGGCAIIPRNLMTVLRTEGRLDESSYLRMMQWIRPIGYSDCNPNWWKAMPKDNR